MSDRRRLSTFLQRLKIILKFDNVEDRIPKTLDARRGTRRNEWETKSNGESNGEFVKVVV